MTAVEEWANGKDPDFFSSELMALAHSSFKCITLESNYMEKKKRWVSTGNKSDWLLIDYPRNLNETWESLERVPAGIWCQNDVVSTLMRRHHVASTLIRRHFYVMCPMG